MSGSRSLQVIAIPALALALAAPARAQTGRQALIAGTQAYDLANFDSSIALLSRGLDPSASPRDSLWRTGVRELAYALLQRNEVSLAETWLKWALRLEPGLSPDSVNFPPTVWLAFDDAKTFVASNPVDTVVAHVTWQWSTAPAALTSGALVARSTGQALTARIENGEVLPVGAPKRMAPGSYTVVAMADGYQPARASVEVLPGVATQLALHLRRSPPGLLYVASRPWGTVYLDSARIGYTTIAARPVPPGVHRLRVERDGFAPFDTTFAIGPDQRLRLGPIRLQPRTP